MQSAALGNDQNYLLLFDALESMERFDEKHVKSQFAGHHFIRQLHVTKNYLRKLIMKSLRNFYARDSSDMKLHDCLQDIEVLFKRDLFELCLKSIRSAEKLAIKYENHLALLEILSWKRRLQLLRIGPSSGKQEINEIITREKRSIKRLQHLSEYWSLTMEIPDRFGNPDFQNFLNSPYLQSDQYATSYRSKILYYHLQYTSQTILGKPKKAEHALDQLIQFLEGNKEQITEDPGAYITALNNKIGLYLNFKRLGEIPPLLQKIRGIPDYYGLKAKARVTSKLWLRTYNVELEIFRDSRQYQKGIQLIPKVRVFLEQFRDHIPMEYHVLFHYQFAYLFFMQDEYSKALGDINQILVQRYSGVRNDIVGYAQFLNLIIHYELDNITVLRYAVDATRRFLKKRGNVRDFEKVLLNFFSRISTRPQSHHLSLFKAVEKKLFGEAPLLDENQLDYLDFRWWLSSKSKGKRGLHSPAV